MYCAVLPLPFENGRRRIKAIHVWHLNIHENQIDVADLSAFQRQEAIANDGDCVSCVLDKRTDMELIDFIVFRQKYSETAGRKVIQLFNRRWKYPVLILRRK